jgi:hypothetical protein
LALRTRTVRITSADRPAAYFGAQHMWKGNQVKPFPIWFWWLKCTTQIIGLISLLYIIYSTGAKGSTQTNKKIQVRVQKKGTKETEENPGLAHRTVRCATEQCPVHQGRSTQTLHLRVSGEPLRYNLSDCPVWHRTVRCASGATAIERNGQLQRSSANVNSAQTIRAESEQRQKAHRTVNSDWPVQHRTVRCTKKSELQQSKLSEP